MTKTTLKINTDTKSVISLQYLPQTDKKPRRLKMDSPDYSLTISVPSAANNQVDEFGIALERFHEKFALALPEQGFKIHYAGKNWIAVEA